jgi:anion-transporting  ArsA/GET3 family ATPase
MTALAEALAHKRVLICLGSGGVGKTTVSATLALRAAMEGRSAIVCTIDPARRLANSLGLQELGNTETRIADEVFHAAGLTPKAPLRAMMLDMKQAWDEMIIKLASPDRREKIFSNRFYKSLSTALAGSQEYIAMEKLLELRAERDYRLIVLDTPPTVHALDFLDAPNRVLDFLDNEAAKWLLTPALLAGKVGLELFNLGGSYVTKTLAKFTGTDVLQELANFLLSMSGLNDNLRQSAHQVRTLLASAETGFVLVTTAGRERLDEVAHFQSLLRQNRMDLAAVVVNRVNPPPQAADWDAAKRLAPPLRDKLVATLDELRSLAEQDTAGVAEIAKVCAPTPLVEVPRFELDVHDLAALWRTGTYLAGEARIDRTA